jgi:hypothetical protein
MASLRYSAFLLAGDFIHPMARYFQVLGNPTKVYPVDISIFWWIIKWVKTY